MRGHKVKKLKRQILGGPMRSPLLGDQLGRPCSWMASQPSDPVTQPRGLLATWPRELPDQQPAHFPLSRELKPRFILVPHMPNFTADYGKPNIFYVNIFHDLINRSWRFYFFCSRMYLKIKKNNNKKEEKNMFNKKDKYIK